MTKSTTVWAALLVGASAVALVQEGVSGQRSAQSVTTTTLYLKQCATCHGTQGKGKPGVRPLNGSLAHGNSVEDISTVIRDGVKDTTMQGFRGTLNEAQIKALAEFVHEMSK